MACDNKSFSSAFTVPRLEALEAAIAEGVLRVKYSDKEVQYRSLAEMLQVRDIMRRALGLKKKCGASGIFGGSRIRLIHGKGIDDET